MSIPNIGYFPPKKDSPEFTEYLFREYSDCPGKVIPLEPVDEDPPERRDAVSREPVSDGHNRSGKSFAPRQSDGAATSDNPAR